MNTNTNTIDKGFTVHTTKMADGTYETGIFEVEPYLITPRQRQYTIEKVYRITGFASRYHARVAGYRFVQLQLKQRAAAVEATQAVIANLQQTAIA